MMDDAMVVSAMWIFFIAIVLIAFTFLIAIIGFYIVVWRGINVDTLREKFRNKNRDARRDWTNTYGDIEP
jgi:hypothetical protein